MVCRWIHDELTAYADGELHGWRARRVRRHLSHCAACGKEAAAVAASVAGHRRMLQALAEADIAVEPVLGRVRREIRAARHVDSEARGWNWIPSKRLVLAAAALIVGEGGVEVTRGPVPGPEPRALSAPSAIKEEPWRLS